MSKYDIEGRRLTRAPRLAFHKSLRSRCVLVVSHWRVTIGCCTMMTCHSPWKPFIQGINKVVQGCASVSRVFIPNIQEWYNAIYIYVWCIACIRVHIYTRISRFARESNGTRYRSECVENTIDSLDRPVDLFSTLYSRENQRRRRRRQDLSLSLSLRIIRWKSFLPRLPIFRLASSVQEFLTVNNSILDLLIFSSRGWWWWYWYLQEFLLEIKNNFNAIC